MELFYILSLERTRPNHPCWWRPARMGYTHELDTAGRYSRQEAMAIHATDIFRNDIPVPCDIVDEARRNETDAHNPE